MGKYDATEANQILAAFAGGRLKNGDRAMQAARELLGEFLDLCTQAGLSALVIPATDGAVISVPGGASTAIKPHQRTGQIHFLRDGKPADLVPLQFNAGTGIWEGTEPDSASPELGYRKPKRSALAVLAQAVLKKLEADE